MLKKKKKTILVTGGAGFIGSHLCEKLLKKGNRLISLDNYFTGSEKNHLPGVDYRRGHTKDIENYIKETPEIIYHLGEYSRVAKSIEEPAIVWDLNILGTLAVTEFCLKHKCKLVYVGSSTKYAKARLDGIAGKDLSPYTWAKAVNTELVKNYGKWYGLSYAIAYFSNVYGPRELAGEYGTVVEIFKQQYLKSEPLTARKPGNQQRNYTHVDDTVRGLILVGQKGKGDGYIISSKKSYSTLEVAKLFNYKIKMLPARTTSRPSPNYNVAKMEKLGWQEKESLKEYIDNFLSANQKK